MEAERLREGIMDVFEALTLAERAREALVGVVIALGKATKRVVDSMFFFSSLVSRETGRVLEASSLELRLTLFPDAAASVEGGSALKDLERGRPDSDLSRPALELLRFNDDEVVGAVTLL